MTQYTNSFTTSVYLTYKKYIMWIELCWVETYKFIVLNTALLWVQTHCIMHYYGLIAVVTLHWVYHSGHHTASYRCITMGSFTLYHALLWFDRSGHTTSYIWVWSQWLSHCIIPMYYYGFNHSGNSLYCIYTWTALYIHSDKYIPVESTRTVWHTLAEANTIFLW